MTLPAPKSSADWEAIGTVSAVVIAVLGGLFRSAWRWFHRPILQLRFANDDPWVRVARAGTDHTRYYRISVENIGKTPARGVRAWVAEFSNADGQPRRFFDPFILCWSGRLQDTTEAAKLLLLPGQQDVVDVLCHPFATSMTGHRWDFRPASTVQRGIEMQQVPFEGQTIVVRVAGKNVSKRAIRLVLPHAPTGSAASICLDSVAIDTDLDSLTDALRLSWRSFKKQIGEPVGPAS